MIQVVFVKWGKKYGPHYIKGLLAAIRRHTEEEIRPLCITDDPAGLPEDVTTVPFPDFGLPLDDLIGFGGCFPKLSIFAEGILEPDLKTIYFDIDTAVLGDVARLTELLDDHPCLYGLANHIVPTWRTPRLQKYTADGHFFINSSVMVFYPRRHGSIFTDFLEQYPEYLSKEKRNRKRPLPMISDERFISEHEKGSLRGIPFRLGGSFQNLYMGPMETTVKWFPWLMRERAGVVLTFHGEQLKPERVAGFVVGQEVRQNKFSTVWQHPQFTAYWTEILDGAEA